MTTTEFTSASANKHIRALEEEKSRLLGLERDNATYILATGEEEEPPAYSYQETRDAVDALDAEIRKVRCALHKFNMDTTLPGSEMNIDECLVYLAQLSTKARRVNLLRCQQPKTRKQSYGMGRNSSVIEYEYANYDIAEPAADYKALSEEIAALQLKLDLVNQTKTFTVEL